MKTLGWSCKFLLCTIAFVWLTIAAHERRAYGQRNRAPITWVNGTVRDEAGKPVSGAEVFARVTYFGPIREDGLVKSAVSGPDGRYAIEGESGLQIISSWLIAYIPDRPLAMTWFPFPRSYRIDKFGTVVRLTELETPEVDLVIPARGGELQVLVSRDGKVVPNVNVALRLEGIDPFERYTKEQRTDVYQRLYSLCRPLQVTTSDGIACFNSLLPGLYTVSAIEGKEETARALTRFFSSDPFKEPPSYGQARNIAVRAGETITHQLAMFQHAYSTKIEVRKDGQNFALEKTWWLSKQMLSGEFTPRFTDWPGFTDTLRFETLGLARVSGVQYSKGSCVPNSSPSFSVEGLIAVSPRLSNVNTLILTPQAEKRRSVFVRIEDEAGMPIEGLARFDVVLKGNRSSQTKFQKVAAGGSVLSGFEPVPGRVEAIARGEVRIFPNRDMVSMPPPERLVGKTEILPVPLDARNHEEQMVTLRFEKVGYVHGRLIPAAKRSTAQYRVIVGATDYYHGANVFYQPESGEFLAGPYRSGMATLEVVSTERLATLWMQKVAVRAGDVTQTELNAAEFDDHGNYISAIEGKRIWMADGITPARMASVAYFNPGDLRPRQWGTSDTSGVVGIRSFEFEADTSIVEPDKPDTLREPVYLTWLPGHCGATIVTASDWNKAELPIVLPPPMTLGGKVIVVGEGDALQHGTATVRAQYEGRGKLNDLLSVETTADAQGEFELAGLTPGKYSLQAVLDKIWVSPSTEFVVNGAALAPVELKIQPPGGPVSIKLTGRRSQTVESMQIDRPTGPLTDRLWPKTLTPDIEGMIRIPALEAGKHILRIGQTEKEVLVPPLHESHGVPVEVEFFLGAEN